MQLTPTHSSFGTPIGEWIECVANELLIDAVGLWQVVGPLEQAFSLSGEQLEHYVQASIAKLVECGALPVQGNDKRQWSVRKDLAYPIDQVPRKVVQYWQSLNRQPDVGDLWFALPCFIEDDESVNSLEHRPTASHQFRVTKYDPAYRTDKGSFKLDDWTSSADIGNSFNGEVLTEDKYKIVERAYLETALAFLQEAHVSQLTVVGLENHNGATGAPTEGDILALNEIPSVLSSVLGERYWCKLENPNAYIHVGHDFYMYVGVPVACPAAVALAQRSALYVEPFLSPYLGNVV